MAERRKPLGHRGDCGTSGLSPTDFGGLPAACPRVSNLRMARDSCNGGTAARQTTFRKWYGTIEARMRVLDRFNAALSRAELCDALRVLNASAPYRFSAIFRFDGDMLRSVCLVDKEDASVKSCEDLPIADSYCVYIHRTAKSFAVEHAESDRRVDNHPKQHNFQCYYGVPLLDGGGRLLGTVCHFDIRPIPLSGDVVALLDDVAPAIAAALSSEAE